MADKLGPSTIMDLLRCKCTISACKTRQCSCRRFGFKCLPACSNCHGVSCDNADSLNTAETDSDNEDDCDGDCDGDLPDQLLDSELDWLDEETISLDCDSGEIENLDTSQTPYELDFFVDSELQAELLTSLEVVVQ